MLTIPPLPKTQSSPPFVCVCVCSGAPLHVHLSLLTSINSSKYPAAGLLLQELHWFIAFNFSSVADSRQAFILTWLRFLKTDNISSLNLPSLCSLVMVHVFHACVLWNLSTPYRLAFLYTSQTQMFEYKSRILKNCDDNLMKMLNRWRVGKVLSLFN